MHAPICVLALLLLGIQVSARVVEVPVGKVLSVISGNWTYAVPSICNGVGALRTNRPGDLLPWMFYGTSITAFMIRGENASMARIELDDIFQEGVDLYDPDSDPASCNTLQWTSKTLPYGPHTLKVSHFGNSAVKGAPLISTMYITKLEYIIPDDISWNSNPVTTASQTAAETESTLSPTSKPKSDNVGAIVGGVVGGVVALAVLLFLLWWRRRQNLKKNIDDIPSDVVEDDKPTPWIAPAESAHPTPTSELKSSPLSPSRPKQGTPWAPTTSLSATLHGGPSQNPLPVIIPTSMTPSPAYSVPGNVGTRLSAQQLDTVQNLITQNVPGPTIAAIVDSMLADPTPRQVDAAPAYQR